MLGFSSLKLVYCCKYSCSFTFGIKCLMSFLNSWMFSFDVGVYLSPLESWPNLMHGDIVVGKADYSYWFLVVRSLLFVVGS